MQVGRPLFSQVMDFVPWTSFDRLVEKYGGDKNATRLRCAAQFRAMAFAQMTFRESLRDIEASLNTHPSTRMERLITNTHNGNTRKLQRI